MFLYAALSNHPSPKLNKCFVHSKQKISAAGQLLAETSFEPSLHVQLGGRRPSLDSLQSASHGDSSLFRYWRCTNTESLCQLGNLLTIPFVLRHLAAGAACGTVRIPCTQSALYLSGGNLCHTNWRLWHHNRKKPQTRAASSPLVLACFSHPASLPGNPGSPVGQP